MDYYTKNILKSYEQWVEWFRGLITSSKPYPTTPTPTVKSKGFEAKWGDTLVLKKKKGNYYILKKITYHSPQSTHFIQNENYIKYLHSPVPTIFPHSSHSIK